MKTHLASGLARYGLEVDPEEGGARLLRGVELMTEEHSQTPC